MTVETYSNSYASQPKESPRDEVFLDANRRAGHANEIIHSEQRRRSLGRNILKRRRIKDYEYDSLNQAHDTAMKNARQVMRRRLHFEATNGIHIPLPKNLEQDVSALYGQAGRNLQSLYFHSKEERRNLELVTDDYIKRLGNLCESTFLALFARSMRGDTTDPTITIPTPTAIDQLGYDEHGINHGYDFHVLKRGGEPVKLQVKTFNYLVAGHEDAKADAIRYSPDILVLSLEGIAGSRQGVPVLQRSIMSELAGLATPGETRFIDVVADRLHTAIDRHTVGATTNECASI
jgi:hypothetical protein